MLKVQKERKEYPTYLSSFCFVFEFLNVVLSLQHTKLMCLYCS